MQYLSPDAKKLRIKKKTGARNQKKGTKKKVCSDGACVVPAKPKANNSSDKNPRLVRVSPNRKRKIRIRTHKKAIAYPGMKIRRRDSSIARSLQKKMDESFTKSLENKGFDPFPQYIRRDSSIARSLQKKMDESLARSLQRKHDLTYALELDRIINNRGHPNDDEMIARLLQRGY